MTAQHPECLHTISQIGHAGHVVRVHKWHNRDTTHRIAPAGRYHVPVALAVIRAKTT